MLKTKIGYMDIPTIFQGIGKKVREGAEGAKSELLNFIL